MRALSVDLFAKNPENAVLDELLENVPASIPLSLTHDIFFAEGFLATLPDGSSLIQGMDYDLVDEDILAYKQSRKPCFRKVVFYQTYPQILLSYHVYCDLVKVEVYNHFCDFKNLTLDDLKEGKENFFYTDQCVQNNLALQDIAERFITWEEILCRLSLALAEFKKEQKQHLEELNRILLKL